MQIKKYVLQDENKYVLYKYIFPFYLLYIITCVNLLKFTGNKNKIQFKNLFYNIYIITLEKLN